MVTATPTPKDSDVAFLRTMRARKGGAVLPDRRPLRDTVPDSWHDLADLESVIKKSNNNCYSD